MRKTQSGSDMVLIGNVDGKWLNAMLLVYSLIYSPNKCRIHGQGMRGRWHRGKSKGSGVMETRVPNLVPCSSAALLWVISLKTEFTRLQSGNST